VACGDGHTVLLSSRSVITWGVKDYQCLGKKDSYHVQSPRALPPGLFTVKKMVQGQEIDSVQEIVHVAAGKCHQAAVGADGTVFTWGDNRFHKLGRGDAINWCTPMPVLFQCESGDADACIPHIASVECGSKCTVMLARDGNVYKAGKRDGQSWRAGLPHKISPGCVGPVRAAAATSERVFAVDERGALWAWGVDVPFVFDRELAGAPVHRGVVWRSEHAPMRLDPPEWRSAHALAFAMLGHRRLGAGSCFGMLDVSLLDMILRFLRAW
jgi:alpha-tubulin suppressor-like RCC1 family protein